MGKTMKNQQNFVNYDAQSDVLYFTIREGAEEEFIEIIPGVHVEIDERGEVIGIEILRASQVLKPVAKSLIQQITSAN